tara:strand:- start:2266 stop:3564 length:1299 start_codon:yes stop_codon:yes gene_type:complete
VTQKDVSNLNDLYKNNGYTQFTLDNLQFIEETQTLAFQCVEGKVDKRRLHGLNENNRKVVTREFNRFDFSTFNLYDEFRLRSIFIETGFFSNATYPKTTPQNNRLILDYYFSEKKFNYFDLGIEEMRDENALAIFFQIKLRNLFLYSDYFTMKTQIQTNDGAQIRSYGIDYLQPWILNNYPLSGKISLWTQFRRDSLGSSRESYSNKRVGGSLSTSLPFNKYLSTIDLRIKQEVVTPYLNATFIPYDINSARIKLSHDTRLSILNAKKGYYITTSLERGSVKLGSSLGTLNYSRSFIEGGYFLPLSKKTTLASRVSFGQFLRDRTTITETFESEGFILGGGNTLRGTPALSYIDDQRFLSNIELRQDISENIQGVVFIDAGMVYDQHETLNLGKLSYGVGFGVRFLTGIIPLRLDLGFGEDVILHFNVGQLF